MKDALPQLDLTTFFLSVSAAVLQALEASPPEVDMAKHNIDLLELMQQKTRGNRTDEEDQLLQHLLFQVRMNYVQVTQAGKSDSSSAMTSDKKSE